MKKIIVCAGLIFLIAGLLIFLLPVQEVYTEIDVSEWDLHSRVLDPSGQDHDSTFYATLMKHEWWFQLNLSSSDPVELQVSILQHNPEEKVPIFNQTGSNFKQNVFAQNTGTYVIDIKNTNPSPVTLEGKVLAKQLETNTIHPYALPGFLIILVGAATLLFGIFKGTKKHSKPKRAKSEIKK